MRIAIVGGGVGGLTTYLFLKKHLPQPPNGPPHEYVLYESHQLPRKKDLKGPGDIPSIGVGFGIGPNGMNALHDLDPKLHDEILAEGFPSTAFDFHNSRGWRLGQQQTTYKYGDRIEATQMITREAVSYALLDRVPDDLIVQKSVAKVSDGEGKGQALIEFADGSSESFDLVIGADGVRSKVRTAILDDKYGAEYTGLFGMGGYFDTSLLSALPESRTQAGTTGQVVMTFGANGFFGYTPCSTAEPVTNTQLRRDEAVKRGERAFWWSSFERDDSYTRNVDMEEQKQKLRARHKDWSDPAIRCIVESEDLQFIPVATWVMPKAPTWVGKRIALIGDAAHALPSSSGQGVSQAMLDSQALALLLSHHLSLAYTNRGPSEESILAAALKHYVQVRKPIVEKILENALRMGSKKKDMGFFEEMLTYGILKIVFTFFSDALQRPIMEYDVKSEIAKVVKEDS